VHCTHRLFTLLCLCHLSRLGTDLTLRFAHITRMCCKHHTCPPHPWLLRDPLGTGTIHISDLNISTSLSQHILPCTFLHIPHLRTSIINARWHAIAYALAAQTKYYMACACLMPFWVPRLLPTIHLRLPLPATLLPAYTSLPPAPAYCLPHHLPAVIACSAGVK